MSTNSRADSGTCTQEWEKGVSDSVPERVWEAQRGRVKTVFLTTAAKLSRMRKQGERGTGVCKKATFLQTEFLAGSKGQGQTCFSLGEPGVDQIARE